MSIQIERGKNETLKFFPNFSSVSYTFSVYQFYWNHNVNIKIIYQKTIIPKGKNANYVPCMAPPSQQYEKM